MRNKTLVNGSLFSIFSLFNQGISFCLLILLANFIDPAGYGMLSLFNTVIMFVCYFISLSSDGYISVSFFKATKEDFPKDVSSVLLILISMTCLLLMVVLVGGNLLSSSLKLSTVLLVIAVFASFFQVLVNINLNLKRVKEDLKIYGILSCGFALFNFILSLLLVVSYSMNWKGRVYAQIICLALFGIISIITLYKDRLYTTSISIERIKAVMIWGIPLIPHLATTWIRQGCDRYIVNYYYTIEDVGLFSFALNLTMIIEVIGSSFNSTNSVQIYKILSDDKLEVVSKKHRLKNLTNEMVIIYSLATLCVMLGGYMFVPVFIPNYSESTGYFLILSVYGFLRCLYFTKCNYLFYWDKNKYLMYVTFCSSLLHLGLSLLLTRYSLVFTCWIYCVTQFLIYIAICIMSNRLTCQHLKN